MAIERTNKLGLPIIPESEYATTKVVDMIKANQGDQPDSAFNIIDKAVEELEQKIDQSASAEAIQHLQDQIDAIESRTDVVDIVATKAALDAYDKSKLSENDVIKVLADESRSGAITYYRLVSNAWSFIGAVGPYYTVSEVDTKVSNLQTAITNETTRATEAETQLRNDLTAEATARYNVDVAIQNNLISEAGAREAADTALDTKIEAETTRAETAESGLQSDIEAEAAARENADETLQSNIEAEETRATAAEEALQDNIDAEAQARQSADSALNTKIETETTRATTREDEIAENVSTEITRVIEIIDSKTSSRVYNNIQAMVTEVNSLNKDQLVVGDNIYFYAEGMPALWTVSIEETSVPYTYTTDAAFLGAITANKATTVQVGYFKFFKLSAGSDIKYLLENGEGDLTLNILNNQVITCTSNHINSLTLTIPALSFPFYSELTLSGDQEWAATNDFKIINGTGKDLVFVQWNHVLTDYKPSTHSSTSATIDLLFYYDNIKNISCYVNEVPNKID